MTSNVRYFHIKSQQNLRHNNKDNLQKTIDKILSYVSIILIHKTEWIINPYSDHLQNHSPNPLTFSRQKILSINIRANFSLSFSEQPVWIIMSMLTMFLSSLKILLIRKSMTKCDHRSLEVNMFAVNDDIALCCPAMIMIMSDVCHGGIFCHI